ncbi:hypothetical protein FPV67DRAFT_1217860 [Lyophyllum atratum]|nr:hypothetical protein FPV67DRAFT_1217860 [Lyophyllum atratum]
MPNTLSLFPWVDTRQPEPVDSETFKPLVRPPEPPKYACKELNCTKQFGSAYSLRLHVKVHRQKNIVKPILSCPLAKAGCHFTDRCAERIREHVDTAHIDTTLPKSKNDLPKRTVTSKTSRSRLRRPRKLKEENSSVPHVRKKGRGLDATKLASIPNFERARPQQHLVVPALVVSGYTPAMKAPGSSVPYPPPIRAMEGFAWSPDGLRS